MVKITGFLAGLLLAMSAIAEPRPHGNPSQEPAATSSDALLLRAKSRSPQRARAAESLGAHLEKTTDSRSFGLVWQPAGRPPVGWIITLHGSSSWAHDEIVLWQPFAEKQNLGIVALQWWFGGGQRMEDYYRPNELRRELEHLIRRVGAKREHVLLHGFSRGSANLYALVAFDAQLPNKLFKAVIANAGGLSEDFPANRDMLAGRLGDKPYAGTRWWLYCGANDANPDRDGCPAMRRSREQLVRRGAEALLAEDVSGDHGGFHRQGQNVEKALEWFLRPPR